MIIAYDSLTGNVQRFIGKIEYPSVRISEGLLMSHPFVLVSYTIGQGDVPETTARFLAENHRLLQAVSSSGNKNWGSNFGKCADRIAREYNVPIISKFELSGTSRDVATFNEGMRILNEKLSRIERGSYSA